MNERAINLARTMLFKAYEAIRDFMPHSGWKITSYLRDSPSHKTGFAMDIAPSPRPSRDPLMNLKTWPLEDLFAAAQIFSHVFSVDPSLGLMIVAEADHLHMHVLLWPKETTRPNDKFNGRLQFRRFLHPKGDDVYPCSYADFNANYEDFKATVDKRAATSMFKGLTKTRRT